MKKWVSLMLPEYVKALKELEMDDSKVAKPVLDDQQYEELNRVIVEALAKNKMLQFSYFSNGAIEMVTGKIDYVDHIKKEIHIINKEANPTVLNINNIVRIGE